ncbi:D-hexose-6-phosphate mutarotase [Pseudomonas jilinensis]|uniref:Putative glucose-6-phosphate 1-epimerase n=1 Tax=Pseudomonas jilinensis TaxID=2078689 RepID=A0A396RYU5_9PSED|nr:D-hexose-6-phosphate mutarotase [Pseudomonas jilinensis]RHW21436.1 D-hexose-6-phosphate mutarotase [Pseudomonas jilinensis]
MTATLPEGLALTRNAHGREFIQINHPAVIATIALEGAQVIDCVPAGKQPLLWMSPIDPRMPGTALRGGIPLCWPWFGNSRPGPAHGIARTSPWQLIDAQRDDQQVRLRLELAEEQMKALLPDERWHLQVEFVIGKQLSVSLTSTNLGKQAQPLSQALHSYLPVADITQASITGLEGCRYIDQLTSQEHRAQPGPVLIDQEVDRIYYDHTAPVILHQHNGRCLEVTREGSHSLVVWNPWQAKAARLSQFPQDGFRQMVCLEASNAGPDTRVLEPGQSHTLVTRIRQVPGTG